MLYRGILLLVVRPIRSTEIHSGQNEEFLYINLVVHKIISGL
jgi:hypothetical protein